MTTAQATRPTPGGDLRPGQESTPTPRRTPSPPVPWRQSIALAAALTLSAANLNGILEGWSWLPTVALTICLVLLGTLAGRALRLPAWLVTPAGLLTLVFALTAQFLSSSALLWVLPTSRTGPRLDELLNMARDTVVSEVAPVLPNPGIMLVICFGLGVIALLTDVVAVSLRMPTVAGLGLIAVVLAPALIKPQSIGIWGFAAAAAGFLLVLGAATADELAAEEAGSQAGSRAFGRARGQARTRAAARAAARAFGVGFIGLTVALVLAAAIPGFSRGLFPEGSRLNSLGQATGLNPIVTLGQDLRSQGRFGRMTYATSSSEPLYLRSVTLEDFSGQRWAPEQRREARIPNLSRIVPGDEQSFRENSELIYTRISTASFTSPWLLAPYAPLRVSRLDGNWSWDPRNLSVLANDGGTTANQNYTVRSVAPTPSRAELRRLRPVRPDTVDPIFLKVPDNLPRVIGETSRSLTGGIANPYDKAMAIQNYLRGLDFTYSEEAPVEGGYDGSGLDVVAQFLERRSGYCVHFASTMAVLARLADIPSRVAVGYAPGRPTGQTFTGPRGEDLTEYEIDSRDAHAWPELYFEGIGWVRFEPTPSRGVVPSYARTSLGSTGGSTSQDGLDTDPSVAPEVPGAVEEVTDEPTQQDTADAGGATGGERANGGPLVLLVLLGALLPRALRSFRSWRRRKRVRRGAPDAATVAWRETTELGEDFGVPADSAQSPRRYVEHLHAALPLDDVGRNALDRLRSAYEHERYAPPAAAGARSNLWGDVTAVRRSLWAAGSAVDRLRSALLPASLLRRRLRSVR